MQEIPSNGILAPLRQWDFCCSLQRGQDFSHSLNCREVGGNDGRYCGDCDPFSIGFDLFGGAVNTFSSKVR